jgi:spermidine dehydrogenase
MTESNNNHAKKFRSNITRRDFLNGVAIGITASGTLGPLDLLANINPPIIPSTSKNYYPPSLTGLRGSHPGSFEVAHAAAWKGQKWPAPAQQTDVTYDLVVVGAGLSGLSAAWYYQKQHPKAKILILDNHDDFGGHAKRNEFTVNGKKLIGYGGSQSIQTPSQYSKQAKQLLSDMGIQLNNFYKYYDRDFYYKRGMIDGIYFDKAHYEKDKLVKTPFPLWGGPLMYSDSADDIEAAIQATPLSEASKISLLALISKKIDYLPEKNKKEKKRYLKTISYSTYLRKHALAPEEVTVLLEKTFAPEYGLSWDAISASEATYLAMPGTLGLGFIESKAFAALLEIENKLPHFLWKKSFDLVGKISGQLDPYIFHFPDGNAGIARLLVRHMVPGSVPGSNMEDLVTTPVNYSKLDQPDQQVRVRLNSTAVNVQHTDDQSLVNIDYIQNGNTHRVKGKHCILACYNGFIPHLCPEVKEKQAEALGLAEKTPLVYINVALKNWQAFADMGIQRIYSPQSMFSAMYLDFPVSMGEYKFSQDPTQSILLHVLYAPSAHIKSADVNARELYRQGRHKIYSMRFSDFEKGIRNQLDGALGSAGFDSSKDIAGITVNRWPHGYAYSPMELWDDYTNDDDQAPHIVGRKQIHRISIANSDSEARAYVDAAFDSAYRAVKEQLEIS